MQSPFEIEIAINKLYLFSLSKDKERKLLEKEQRKIARVILRAIDEVSEKDCLCDSESYRRSERERLLV